MKHQTIPIQNIYYLLCYAWNKLEERDIVDVDAKDSTNLLSLFSRVIMNGLKHLLKRGLDQNYINYAEENRCLRGKIGFATTIKKNLFPKAMAYCEYDELSHNVIHNQIIKTTLRILYNSDSVNADLKKELVSFYRRLKSIDDIELNSSVFSKVVLQSNNSFYDFLLKICRLIYDSLLIDEGSGRFKFIEFIQDDGKMALMFEEFVRNFYIRETQQYRVKREDIIWDVSDTSSPAFKYLPKMITDISIEKDGRKIIIDTKFYREALATNYDIEKIKSDNLYQIIAYMKNLEVKGGINIGCSGILLYPTVKYNMFVNNIILGPVLTHH